MDCPGEGLQMFMKISVGGSGRRSSHSTAQETRTLPATGNGNTKERHMLQKSGNLREERMALAYHQLLFAARFMRVRLRVHGSFLTLPFLHGSRCSSVRGCQSFGILISHEDGCKHMICDGSTTMRYQVIPMMHGIEDTVVRP